MKEMNLNQRVVAWIKRYADKNFPTDDDPHPNNLFSAQDKDFKGILGECVILTFLGRNIFEYLLLRPVRRSDRGYDIEWANRKWDIKTLLSKVKPFNGYRYNVAAVQTNTLADGFIFCTVLENYSKAYVGGYLEKDIFMKKALFNKAGPSGNPNGFVFPCDAYDIDVVDLKQWYLD